MRISLFGFSYAKALHYKEEEFHNYHDDNIRANVFDSLILVNNKLQQKEAAEALLAMAQLYETDATQVRLYLFTTSKQQLFFLQLNSISITGANPMV